MELRIKDMQFEVNSDGDMKVGGYINVTERESEVLYSHRRDKYFVETMKKGVFERALNKATSNIPLLLEHSWDNKLASIQEDSLKLTEDNVGLKFEARLKDENTYNKVRTGVINSCSFGFKVLKEKIQNLNSKLEKRFVEEIELMEVSLVENPAYVGSLVETRSVEDKEKIKNLKSDDSKEVSDNTNEDSPIKEEDGVKNEKKSKKEKSKKEPSTEEDSKDDIEKSEVKEDEVDSTKEKKDEEKQKKKEDRNLEIVETESTVDDSIKIKELIEEVLESKINQLSTREAEEKYLEEEKEMIKEQNRQIENDIEKYSMNNSLEILKLRCEILKLKDLKGGLK